jgi:E3 ubiquitin-protein ligase TRIP12
MGACTLEACLCLSQQLLEADKGEAAAYAVGESVMARRIDGEFGEGIVLDTLDDGSLLIVWAEEESAAKIASSELTPYGSGLGLATERRQRVAPAFILNNFLMKTAIPSNDLSRVQMVVRDGADVNCIDSSGNSALVLAASSSASVGMIQFLISRGAHVNYVAPLGSALQIAAVQDNVDVVRCLLAHGADVGVVDVDACGEECAGLLKKVLAETEAFDAKAGGSPGSSPLSTAERDRYANDAFCQLMPALVASLGSTQSPKLHKRMLMVLTFVLRRSDERRLAALTPLQLGAVLGALRVLLASPQLLEQFAALRMLAAALKAAPAVGSTARRHGLEPVLARLGEETADHDTAPAADPAAAAPTLSSRARSVGLRAADVATLASDALRLLRAAPPTADEAAPRAALERVQSGRPFGAALRELAALLVGPQAPSAHELQQSGALGWLLRNLSRGSPAELRERWAAFEASEAFGPPYLPQGEGALAQLLQLLHNSLVASETLPVLSHASPGEGSHSLKPLSEPIHIVLHPLHPPASSPDAATPAPPQLSIDPLVRINELQAHLLRTTAPADTAYDAFCERLVGCVIEERPLSPAAPHPPLRRATVTGVRVATPLRLPLHVLEYEGGGGAMVVMASREYRIVGRVPREQLAKVVAAPGAAGGAAVADPDARIHTVAVTCPEGLPVEFFLENVLSEVRRALRQAEPGCAPMTRSVNDDYGWRDRGWERGGAQFERGLSDKLKELGVAAVARRQTKREAETLVARLKDTLMISIELEPDGGGQNGEADTAALERFPLLARVQGLVAIDGEAGGAPGGGSSAGGDSGAHWLPATVVERGPSGLALVFDDGSFESSVPSYRVRPFPQEAAKRLHPLSAIFMTFEQFLSSREERRSELESGAPHAVPANLRRVLSSFHVGRSQQVGHVPMDTSVDASVDTPEPMETDDDAEAAAGEAAPARLEAGSVAPMRLRVRFALGGASGAPPPAAAEPQPFATSDTLLHCLHRLRETSPLASELSPHELGYHPGVTCDRTDMSPIVGDRYKLDGENYDVCEAEFLKMGPAEQARYTRIPPTAFRRPRGCGPAVWHLWYSVDVQSEAEHGAEVAGSPRSPELASPGGPASSEAAAPRWPASAVESGLACGSLSAEAVQQELRTLCAGQESRLSPPTLALVQRGSGHSLAPLMAAYREATGAPRATPAASAPLPAADSLVGLADDLERYGVAGAGFTESISVLAVLAERLLPSGPDEAASGAPEPAGAASSMDNLRRQLASPRLSSKLQVQLGDALAVTAGAMPSWCEVLLRRCPSLFSASARARYFHATAFGVSRALNWSQEQGVAAVRAAYAEELAALDRARLEADVSSDAQGMAEVLEQLSEVEDRISRDRLGALRSDIARVLRDTLLSSAERLMSLHAGCASALEVQFEGESGFGSGVTQNFYSAVANELLKARHQRELPLWMADAAGADPDGFIAHPGHIFPRPLPPAAPARAAVLSRFRFLGRLMAKACRDDFIVPLPLSLDFLHLARGGTLTYAALPPPGATGGVLAAYAAVAAELAAGDSPTEPAAARAARYDAAADAEFAVARMGLGAPMSLRGWLSSSGATLSCPITGAPLVKGGDERELDVHCLREYVHLVAQLWLADGVRAQAAAWREGFDEVIPLSRLSLFTLRELQTTLCGTMRIDWTEAELSRHIHPAGGYSKHSKVYQLLIDELQAMEHAERRAFLNFITACPHLPPVGLASLEIEVLPQHNGTTLPTAQVRSPSAPLAPAAQAATPAATRRPAHNSPTRCSRYDDPPFWPLAVPPRPHAPPHAPSPHPALTPPPATPADVRQQALLARVRRRRLAPRRPR